MSFLGIEISVVVTVHGGYPLRKELLKARVRSVWSSTAGSRKFEYQSKGRRGWRRRCDEGITWCRGWEGSAVNALRAALALSSAAA